MTANNFLLFNCFIQFFNYSIVLFNYSVIQLFSYSIIQLFVSFQVQVDSSPTHNTLHALLLTLYAFLPQSLYLFQEQ